MKSFIEELRRRNVLRVVSLYALSAWLIIQVTTTTQKYIGIPDWFITGIIFLTILLFPIVTVISWRYEVITDKSLSDLKKPKMVVTESGEILARPAPSNNYLMILGPLILGIGLVTFVSLNWLNKDNDNSLQYLKDNPITVLSFTNNTNSESLDWISDIVTMRITRALSSTGGANLVFHNSMLDGESYVELLKTEFGYGTELEEKTGVVNIIEGSYYLIGNEVVFNCQLVEVSSAKIIKVFEEQRAPQTDPIIAVDKLVQYIMGYWMSSDNPSIRENQIMADALIEYRKAIKLWEEDYGRVIVHLKRSIDIDSTFIRAYLLLTETYLNIGASEKADSVFQLTKHMTSNMTESDVDLYSYYEARLTANRKDAYYFYLREFERAPKDLFVNTSALSEAVLVNDTKRAIEISNEIESEWIDQKLCFYCRDRSSFLAQALIDEKRYTAAIDMIRGARYDPIDMSLKELEIRGLVRRGSYDDVEVLLKQGLNQRFTYGDYGYLLERVVYEFALVSDPLKDKYVNLAISYYDQLPGLRSKAAIAEMKLIAGDYEESEQLLVQVFEEIDKAKVSRDQMIHYEVILARARGYQGKMHEVSGFLKYLNSQKNPLDEGGYSYLQGVIYASFGDVDQSLVYLEESVARGRGFYRYDFHNDLALKGLFEEPGFNRILNFYL